MADQATIDIPPETAPVKRGFFRRLFDVTFFPFIWIFSSTFKTLDYLAQSSSWVLIDLWPNLFSSFVLTSISQRAYLLVVYKPTLQELERTATFAYYIASFVAVMLLTTTFQFLVLPLTGVIISFLTWEKFTIRHYKFYHSAFTALIPITIVVHWMKNFMSFGLNVSTIVGSTLLGITVSIALVFLKSVPTHKMKYKCALLEILHFTAVMGMVGAFVYFIVIFVTNLANPDKTGIS